MPQVIDKQIYEYLPLLGNEEKKIFINCNKIILAFKTR
jgi:hypothetical protein